MPIFDVGVSQNRTDELIRQAVLVEREACALAVEQVIAYRSLAWSEEAKQFAEFAAAAIRDRE